MKKHYIFFFLALQNIPHSEISKLKLENNAQKLEIETLKARIKEQQEEIQQLKGKFAN